MEQTKFKLILGSQSPRRKELLKASFINYEIYTSSVKEVSDKENVEDFVKDIALLKAEDVFVCVKERFENPLVLGADTIVVINNEILGKPKTRDEARDMLLKLSGKTHFVYTGVCLKSSSKLTSFSVKTQVTFEVISEDLLELYLDTKESMDKAGAYGIQAYALSFIKEIEGSYSNVVGLPINVVIEKLKEYAPMGSHSQGKWRNYFE